jgi:uncharacterized protein (TIGR03085 family)
MIDPRAALRGWPFTSVAAQERAELCDLFEELGPDAPTLCEGWTTAHLAAHLVTRERRPDAAIGLVVVRLHPRTERIEDDVRERTSYAGLVAKIRGGPPLPMGLPVLREATNTHEYFIHHEDVRRPNGGKPRPVDPARDEVLWRLLRVGARGLFRETEIGVALERPTGERINARGGEGVTVRGNVDELFLLAFGRGGAADVEIVGSPDSVDAFSSATIGV